MDKQTQSPMDRLKKVVAFLLGEDKLDGVSFGERAPGRPWFWWRIELRKAVKALESSAPQVAVPEGWVPAPAEADETMEMAGQRYAQENDPSTFAGIYGAMLAAAPTAPAGNRYSPSATAAMQGLSALRSAVHCGGPWDNAMDDAYETVKAFINQQPVSDPGRSNKQVGCEREDGTLNIHDESKTCAVCAPDERKIADWLNREIGFANAYAEKHKGSPNHEARAIMVGRTQALQEVRDRLSVRLRAGKPEGGAS